MKEYKWAKDTWFTCLKENWMKAVVWKRNKTKVHTIKENKISGRQHNTSEKIMTEFYNTEAASHAHPKYQFRNGFKITQVLYKTKCFEVYLASMIVTQCLLNVQTLSSALALFFLQIVQTVITDGNITHNSRKHWTVNM